VDITILDRADAAGLIDLVRHELGFSSLPKRFPSQGNLPRRLFPRRE
jgi:hypothetical protein